MRSSSNFDRWHYFQASTEKSKKLENLGTVMTLYSRRTFSKESFQWTKCVVKYLYDTYAHLSLNMLAFLVEVKLFTFIFYIYSLHNLFAFQFAVQKFKDQDI